METMVYMEFSGFSETEMLINPESWSTRLSRSSRRSLALPPADSAAMIVLLSWTIWSERVLTFSTLILMSSYSEMIWFWSCLPDATTRSMRMPLCSSTATRSLVLLASFDISTHDW